MKICCPPAHKSHLQYGKEDKLAVADQGLYLQAMTPALMLLILSAVNTAQQAALHYLQHLLQCSHWMGLCCCWLPAVMPFVRLQSDWLPQPGKCSTSSLFLNLQEHIHLSVEVFQQIGRACRSIMQGPQAAAMNFAEPYQIWKLRPPAGCI